jgi:hypothetical protein
VDVLQSWVAVGIPGLAVVAGLFVGHSPLRARIGYGVLAALAVFFALVTADVISAAIIAAIAVALVATGRGTHSDEEYPEHHQNRERFTTAAPEEG